MGAACTASTAGACAPAGLTVAAVSGTMMLHGTGMVLTASSNLSQSNNLGPGESSAGDLKVLSKRQAKKLIGDAEEFKAEFVDNSGRFYNVAVDSQGNVWLVPVKKDSDLLALETGVKLDEITPGGS